MLDHWYFAWGAHRFGPFSAAQLKELATLGRLQPVDTVWKEGIDKGVLAGKVKHLFPQEIPDGLLLRELSGTEELAQPPVLTMRASTVSGAVIMSQDGVTVRYRKKCSKCGYRDSCNMTLAIKNEITRTTFFCPKCRKMSEVAIEGTTEAQ